MNKNFEQMLRLVDYVDGLMVVDNQGFDGLGAAGPNW